MRMIGAVLSGVLLAGMAGCMHIAGVVEEGPGRPMATAMFSVGRPDGITAYKKYGVDSQGRFDFSMSPTDENDLYLYDSAADPRLTMRRLDRLELNDHMRLQMRRANPGMDMGIENP